MASSPEVTDKPTTTSIHRYESAAKFLGIPVGSLYALVHEKRIDHVRLGARTVLFEQHALEAFLKAHRVPAAVQK